MLHLLVALAALSFAEAPARPRAKAVSEDPCKGLRYRFYEALAPQGFLGFETPDATASPVQEALKGAIEAARYEAEDTRTRWSDHFDWPSVCRRAKAKKLKQVWIGCEGDTDVVDGAAYGRLADGEYSFGRVTAACVVSAFRGTEPDFEDLVETSLIPVGQDQQAIYPSIEEKSGDRYDHLANPEFREMLYRRALEGAVYKMGMQDRGIPVE